MQVLCFIIIFQGRSSIRAASPLFLIGIVVGFILELVACLLFTQSSPSDTSCATAYWLGCVGVCVCYCFVFIRFVVYSLFIVVVCCSNVGFVLMFGPLFGKCWRIYKIFSVFPFCCCSCSFWFLVFDRVLCCVFFAVRNEMTVVKITDAGLTLRLSGLLAGDLVFSGIVQAVTPVVAVSRVQSALPRDQVLGA